MSAMRRTLRFLRPYAKEAVLASVMMVFVVLADLAIPTLVRTLIDDGIMAADLSVILRTSLIMVGAAILSALLAIGNTVFSIRASQGLAADLRDALYAKIQSFSFGNLDAFQTGPLLTRLTSDVNQVQMLILLSLRMLTRAPIMLVGSLVMMYVINPALTTNMLVLLPVTLLLAVAFIQIVRPLYLQVQAKLDGLNQVLQESLSGIRVVKAFVRGDYENARFRGVNDVYTGLTVKTAQVMAILFPCMLLVLNVASVAVVYVGGMQAIAGTGSVGVILAFINYLLTFTFPVLMMAMVAGSLSASFASAQRITEVLTTTPTIMQPTAAVPLPAAKGRVVFDRVSLRYDGDGGAPVLQGVSFVAEPGETVALIGATGSGKTSLVHLIPRFYDATAGTVAIDGVDVKDLDLATFPDHVGISLQEPVLFSGTIRDNIRYGRPDATDAEVEAAAKVAHAHEFIAAFPDGYDTRIGQRGVNLSGGQKQRVAIARALLVDPAILILDDSTSAVDVETEAEIQSALDAVMKGRTRFVIAQRISTVLTADKILVIDEGRIAAIGNHEQLMATSPLYREIYDSQLGDGGTGYE